jgi:hypothetical protein
MTSGFSAESITAAAICGGSRPCANASPQPVMPSSVITSTIVDERCRTQPWENAKGVSRGVRSGWMRMSVIFTALALPGSGLRTGKGASQSLDDQVALRAPEFGRVRFEVVEHGLAPGRLTIFDGRTEHAAVPFVGRVVDVPLGHLDCLFVGTAKQLEEIAAVVFGVRRRRREEGQQRRAWQGGKMSSRQRPPGRCARGPPTQVRRPPKATGAGMMPTPVHLNMFRGAAGRNRTGDLRITNALLYQLSYSGTKGREV